MRNLLGFFLLLSFLASCSTGPQPKPIDLSGWPQKPLNLAADHGTAPNFVRVLDLIRGSKLQAALSATEAQIEVHPEEPNLYLLKTKILLLQGLKQPALDFISTQIEQRPDLASFREVRGLVLKEMGYLQSAKEDLLVAAQAQLPHLKIYTALTELLAKEKNYPAALSFAEKAVALSPKSAALWFQKAQFELRVKRLQEAFASIDQVIKLAPQQVKYHQFYVDLLAYTGQKSKLGEELKMRVQQFPKTPWFALRLSTFLIETLKIDEAKKVLEVSLKHSPKSELLHFQLGAIFSALKQYPEAESHFLKGLKLKPNQTVAEVQLAKIYLIQGKIEAAQIELSRAAAGGSRNLFVYRALAKLFNDRRDSFVAEKYLTAGLRLAPEDGALLLEYGKLLERKHKYKQAIYAFEGALKRSPNKTYLLGKLSSLNRRLGRYPQAEKYIQLALNVAPISSWIEVQQTALYIKMGSWDKALKVVDQMIQQSPENYWPYAKKAEILIHQGNYIEAKKMIQLAFQQKPEVYQLKELEGQVLVHLKKYKAAAAAYQVALKGNPDNALVWSRLAYAQLTFDPPEALKAVNRSLELEDFELTGLELYLYLTKRSSQAWGFRSNSEEAKIYELIIKGAHVKAAQRLKKLHSPYQPYLSFFNQLFTKGKKAKLSVYQQKPLKQAPGWFSFYQAAQALFIGDEPAALVHFKQANQQNPDDPWIEARLAYSYEVNKEYDKAIPLLLSHLKKRPFSLWAKLRLALNYDFAGLPEKSEAMYLDIIKAKPNDQVALNNLAWLYATAKLKRMRKLDRALELSQKAVSLRASSANLDTLAEILYLKKSYRGALKVIDQALEQDNESLDYFKKQKKKILKALNQP